MKMPLENFSSTTAGDIESIPKYVGRFCEKTNVLRCFGKIAITRGDFEGDGKEFSKNGDPEANPSMRDTGSVFNLNLHEGKLPHIAVLRLANTRSTHV